MKATFPSSEEEVGKVVPLSAAMRDKLRERLLGKSWFELPPPVRKDSPDASDVHVPAPLGTAAAKPKKRKRRKPGSNIRVIKAQHRGLLPVANAEREKELYDVLRRQLPLLGIPPDATIERALAGNRSAYESSLKWSSWETGFTKALTEVFIETVAEEGARRMSDTPLAKASVALHFDARSPATLQWARTHSAQLVRAISDDVRAAIRGVIGRMYESGIAPRDAVPLVRTALGENALFPKWATAVANYAIRLQGEGRAPAQVRSMSGAYYERLADARASTIARTECLPGDALVDGAVVWAVTRRWYEGWMIEVATDDSRHFTATPNHPMLTNRGWLGAGEVAEGDYLVSDGGNQDASSSGDKNVAAPPSTLSEIFYAASAVGVVERRRGTEPDFHGDGRQSEVDVARPHRELRIGSFAPVYEETMETFLSPADKATTPLCRLCRRMLSVDEQPCLCGVADGYVHRDEASTDNIQVDAEREAEIAEAFASKVAILDGVQRQAVDVLVGVSPAVEEELASIRTRASLSSFLDEPGHPLGVGAYLPRDLGDAHPAAVELDRVRATRKVWFTGHVFNLSTPYGYFVANGGVYTGNTIAAQNEGRVQGWQQMVDAGLLNKKMLAKQWDASHEGVCPICDALDGNVVAFDGLFSVGVPRPPAHPNCRCVVLLVRR